MTVKQLDAFPPNANPFHHDAYHMGSTMGNNCTVMFENFEDKECKYLIVINTKTGERIKIIL